MDFAIFLTIFLFITNRGWFFGFIETITGGKTQTKDITDKEILDFIYTKTGLRLSNIKLSSTNKVWGMMGGLPSKPYMVIAKDAYENFNKDELQWLLLHESGHYVLWHNVKCILLQIFLIGMGIYLLLIYSNIILTILLGVIFGIFYIQIVRNFEYEANRFAISKMDNPKGLVNMYDKAKERWRKKGKKEDTFIQKMFNVWILEIYKNLVRKAVS